MAGVRGRGPAGAAEFMGRRRPPVGPRSLGAPNRHRQGCALCRDPSEVERRAPRATTHGPRTRVARLAYGTDAVTRTGRYDRRRGPGPDRPDRSPRCVDAGEYIERSFAHLYDTGGMRRTHLRGHANILKRLLIHAGGFN